MRNQPATGDTLPRVYRISTGWRWFLIAGGCVIAPVFGLGSIYLHRGALGFPWYVVAPADELAK